MALINSVHKPTFLIRMTLLVNFLAKKYNFHTSDVNIPHSLNILTWTNLRKVKI